MHQTSRKETITLAFPREVDVQAGEGRREPPPLPPASAESDLCCHVRSPGRGKVLSLHMQLTWQLKRKQKRTEREEEETEEARRF